eukprot:GHVQ01015789.1.p1 GENE.GHVQ01015789.1~~GHVQ01015789.1.p1  ORF type:complete len:113 (-),score=11.93 GHVQ01015789.1:618-956(-)
MCFGPVRVYLLKFVCGALLGEVMVPQKTQEWELRIFCKKDTDVDRINEAFKYFRLNQGLPDQSRGFGHYSGSLYVEESPGRAIQRQRAQGDEMEEDEEQETDFEWVEGSCVM